MNTSTQNDSQSRENNTESKSINVERSSDPYQQKNGDEAKDILPYDKATFVVSPFSPKFAFLPLSTTVTRKEVDIIKLTSQFVAVCGICRVLQISQKLSILLIVRQQFLRQVLEKEEEDEKGVEMAVIDFHAFQFFVNMEYNVKVFLTSRPGSRDTQPDAPTAEPIRFPLLPQGITHKELATIKLTSQFVAVYGMYFDQGLMESVSTKPEVEPQFQFMKATDSRYVFYSELALGYMRALRPSKKLKDKSISMESLLEGYFKLLHKVLKKEEEKDGAEMLLMIVDLHAFEYFVYVETIRWESPPPGFLSILKNPPPNMQPPPEEPEPKRPKLALVPEDQFLAQNPGSSTIRVPNFNDGKVIEITVQPLSENVASLKEKIANKMELSGKAAVLEDNKSLAHYNVGAGDIITLSL